MDYTVIIVQKAGKKLMQSRLELNRRKRIGNYLNLGLGLGLLISTAVNGKLALVMFCLVMLVNIIEKKMQSD